MEARGRWSPCSRRDSLSPAAYTSYRKARKPRSCKRLDLADIPGVGPALVESLRRWGLVRVEDALGIELEWLQKRFGAHRGRWLHRRIRGLDSARVDPREPRKSISSERTFPADLETDEELEEALMRLSVSVGRTMRRSGFGARTVTVKLRDSDFTTRSRSRTLRDTVRTDHGVYSVARGLLRELRRRRRTRARLLGVGLKNLVCGRRCGADRAVRG